MPDGIDVLLCWTPVGQGRCRGNSRTGGDSEVPTFHTRFSRPSATSVAFTSCFSLAEIKTKSYFSDMELGWKMFRKGRMRLLPYRSKHLGEVLEAVLQTPG